MKKAEPTPFMVGRAMDIIDEFLRFGGHFPGTIHQIAANLGLNYGQVKRAIALIRRENVGGYSIAPVAPGMWHKGITLISPQDNSDERIAHALEGTTGMALAVAGHLTRVMNALRIAAEALEQDSEEWKLLMSTITDINDAAFGASEAANGDHIKI